ncbi:MAG: DNA cytosine methyltransferase [Dehalococcoidia bacterium]
MTKPDTRPTVVDLFAGVGGLALGFEQAGFDVVAAVELDPIHAATHRANFPDTAILCADIRSITGEDIRREAGLGDGAIDCVTGGPPCQGFSLIGQRVLGDRRNELIFHFVRIVKELQPRTFVMENVPGMATGAHTQLLAEVIDAFAHTGYIVRLPYRILNASSYGIPQDRRRLFLMGSRTGEAPDYPSPLTSGGRVGRSKPSLFGDLQPCPTVSDAIDDLPDIEDFECLLDTDELSAQLRGGSAYAQRLREDLVDPFDFSYPRDYRSGLITGCRRARHTPLSRKRFAETRPGTTEPVSRFFRLAPDGLCNTLRAGTATDHGAFTAPRPIHHRYARCISVREAARLHSYPDWFRFHRTIWHGFRQIGNSVPPLLARAVARQISDHLGRQPLRPSEALTVSPDGLVRFTMSEAASYFGVDPDVIAPRVRGVAVKAHG